MDLESALLIIPPRNVQAFAYPLREEFDAESFNRVPAHITLLYPFVPSDEVAEIIPVLETLCAGIPAFEVELDQYGRFDDAIFLESSNPDKLKELYQKLIETFPGFPVYKGEHGSDLHPHMTLARFEDPAKGDQIELPPEPRFTFMVKQLHIYLGAVDDVDAPFIPRAVIPLGNPE